jgi:PAS domain S-box-containing protein
MIRGFAESNIIGIFVWEFPDTRIMEANDAFLRMVGYEREELLPGRKTLIELTPPEWESVSLQAVAILQRGGTVQPYEKEYLRKDGSRVPVIAVNTFFEASDVGAKRGMSYVIDLTERRRAEEALGEMRMQLEHANRVATMGQLTASIAHEVDQPTAATLANAQAALRWLRLDPPDLEEANQALGRIIRDSARAGDVIQRIRNLAKKVPTIGDRVEINAAIREVIDITRSEATKNGVMMRTQLAEDVPAVKGDRVELQQVILNLVLNAVEAMSGAGEGPRELLISTGKAERADILVSVSDSGPGLSPEIQENLFKAFYTTKPNGLGLGLSICRSIIEIHGGRLWASANAPCGAVFQFILPSISPIAPPP